MTIDLTKFTIHPDARWVAADYCGAVYAFTDRPVCLDGKHWMSDGECSWYLGEIDMAGIDCRKVLMMLDSTNHNG